MALSEREQQMLDQMEQALYAEDPRVASSMKGDGPTPEQRRRRVLGLVGVLAGVGLVFLGVITTMWVGVAGFAVIVASIAYMVSSGSDEDQATLGVVGDDGSITSITTARPPRRRRRAKGGASAVPSRGAKRPQRSGPFMQRLEQRWDERRERGY